MLQKNLYILNFSFQIIINNNLYINNNTNIIIYINALKFQFLNSNIPASYHYQLQRYLFSTNGNNNNSTGIWSAILSYIGSLVFVYLSCSCR